MIQVHQVHQVHQVLRILLQRNHHIHILLHEHTNPPTPLSSVGFKPGCAQINAFHPAPIISIKMHLSIELHFCLICCSGGSLLGSFLATSIALALLRWVVENAVVATPRSKHQITQNKNNKSKQGHNNAHSKAKTRTPKSTNPNKTKTKPNQYRITRRRRWGLADKTPPNISLKTYTDNMPISWEVWEQPNR